MNRTVDVTDGVRDPRTIAAAFMENYVRLGGGGLDVNLAEIALVRVLRPLLRTLTNTEISLVQYMLLEQEREERVEKIRRALQ